MDSIISKIGPRKLLGIFPRQAAAKLSDCRPFLEGFAVNRCR